MKVIYQLDLFLRIIVIPYLIYLETLVLEIKLKLSKNSDPRGFVIIRDYYADHKRGLNGFDRYSNRRFRTCFEITLFRKSAYIWNTIAIPNSDCIRGIVEKSTNQNYLNSEKRGNIRIWTIIDGKFLVTRR